MPNGGFDVFLSYARSDGAVAAELNAWLRAQGLRTFFDRSELRPGLRWIPALEEAIGASDAVAILVGRHGIGNTQQYERELALVRQTHDNEFPVIPVLMPGCENPPTGLLQLLTWVDLSQGASVLQQQDSLEALRGAIHRQPVPASRIRAEICPYRGLEPFREEDAAFFCGRDDAIRELVTQVQAHSFVAVVGRSGSGKSSLVFAGLLPALRQQRQTTMWDVVSLRPGASPLRALAAAFGTVPENAGPAAIDTYLENEAAAYRKGDIGKLARIVNDRLDAAREKPDRLLIYVDQWEELYAMAPAVEDAERRKHSDDVEKFIALLTEAASGQRLRASVVLTVRADFYGPLIRHALLSTLLPRQQMNIPPMEPSDLRSAIETPAKKVGLSFTPPALVDQILNDVGTDESRLPLLQFALKETWEGRQGDRLTAEAYVEVGGVTGAIQRTAERVYAALTPAQQEAARRLFLRLVTPGEGQEDTRARSAIPDDPQQRDIVDLFSDRRTRLLVTGYDALQGPAMQAGLDVRATVEVAHEALIRRWPTLREWVRVNREKLRARAAILQAKIEWDEHGRDERFLLPPGVQLQRGRALLDNPGDVAVDDICDYVGLSIEKEDHRLAAERDARRREHARQTRRRVVFASALAVAALVIGLAYLGLADAGVAVYRGTELRSELDLHGWSVFRRVASREEMLNKASEVRDRIRPLITAELAKKQLMLLDNIQLSVWDVAQAVAAVYRDPHAAKPELDELLPVLNQVVQDELVVFVDGHRVGWRDTQPLSRAESAIWIVMALTQVISRKDDDAEAKSKFLRHLNDAQEIADHYYPLRDGGWNMAKEDNPGDHHIYTTTLALHALLELHSAGLCWREDCAQLEQMIRASADWLIRAFVEEDPSTGWRNTLDDTKPPDPDLSIFVYGALGRANVDLGVELPTNIERAAIKRLMALKDRLYYPAQQDIDYSVPLPGDQGRTQYVHLPTRVFWYPWAVESLVHWLRYADRNHFRADIARAFQRSLGHVLVDDANDMLANMSHALLFVRAETLYGIGRVQ